MQPPKRGFTSTTLIDDPAREWQQALISGNGRMGAMVIGHPLDETIILSEEHLFLPLHKPLPPVHLASHLDKIRHLLLDSKPLEASRLAVNQTYVERWGEKRWTDPLIPAFDLRANMSSKGPIRDYLRGVDFETGVASVEWMDNRGAFLRRLFVSRADDVVVLSIISPASAKINCRLSLAKHYVHWELNSFVNEGVRNPEINAEDCWLTYRCGFRRRWPGSLQGYEGVARVVAKGGSTSYEGAEISVKEADEVIVLVRIGLLMDFTTSNIGDLKSALEALNTDFDHLLERHARIHGEIINRVRLDLGGGEDRNLTSEELLGKSRAGHLNKALLEKEFDAGRYAILSSTGEWPPTLQGVWTGCWNPPWSSDYTLNGNVQAAIAIGLPGNMPEVLRALFNYIRAFLPHSEENAKRMYNCRGIHIASRASSHGLNNHFDAVWPMCYWTAGAGWIARFYYDYWLYSGDRDFLERECLPFMEQAALFYEDFLVEGADGKYMFIPSYSPENDPGNSPNAACINATMDVAVARELLRNLIELCESENLRPEKIGQWKAMLAKLPTYMIAGDGELKEWTWPTLDNNDKHRHASHLYPLYYTVDPEIAKSPELIEACRKAIESRLEFRRRQGGGDMAFGLFQLGIAASNLREAEMAYEAVDTLGRLYWHSSMGSTHNARDLFNVDISGGMPALVIQMLVNSEAGLVDILPALPKAWPTGRIEGIPLRGRILVESLAWEADKATVALKSAKDQTVTLRLPAPIRDIRIVRGAAKIGAKHAQRDRRGISLSAGQSIVLEIFLR